MFFFFFLSNFDPFRFLSDFSIFFHFRWVMRTRFGVFTSVPSDRNRAQVPTKHDSSELLHIESVPSNVKLFQSKAMLCVFEDNEAVIKMIIKGRNPTMKHVSRTHRVSLDGLLMGCLTELIWIPRFRLVTVTPNINSQTF